MGDKFVGVYDGSRILVTILGNPSKRWVILVVVLAWLVVLSLSAWADGSFFPHGEGTNDVLRLTDVHFTEDLFTLSIVLSMGLVFYFSFLAFNQFDALFSPSSFGESTETTRLGIAGRELSFINHGKPVSMFYYSVLLTACVFEFAVLASGYFSRAGSNIWWNGPETIGGAASLALDFFLLIFVGPPLAWRLLATTYCTSKVLKAGNFKKVPSVIISTDFGIGQVFRFAALTAAVPLSTAPPLIVWLVTRGDLMIVWSISAGAVIGAVAMITFLVPTTAAMSIVKMRRQEELDQIDEKVRSFIMHPEMPESDVPRERFEIMMMRRESLVRRDAWPYGWLTAIGLAVLTETLIAGLTSLHL